MKDGEIVRVERYLRSTFGCQRIRLPRNLNPDGSVEVFVDEEFLGVIFRDDEDGEVSFAFHMAIMEMDLPKD